MGSVEKTFVILMSGFAYVMVLLTTLKLTWYLSSQRITIAPPLNVVKRYGYYMYPALWNMMLLGGFACQHTGMASKCWKSLLFKMQLRKFTRSIYVIMTCLLLQGVLEYWEPMPASSALWVFDTNGRDKFFPWLFFFLLHFVMWCCIFTSTLVMDQMDLIGAKQAYYNFIDLNEPYSYRNNAEQKLLRNMRHPGATCFFVILWIHPVMTLQRLFLALSWTFYLLFGFSVNENNYFFVRQQLINNRQILGNPEPCGY